MGWYPAIPLCLASLIAIAPGFVVAQTTGGRSNSSTSMEIRLETSGRPGTLDDSATERDSVVQRPSTYRLKISGPSTGLERAWTHRLEAEGEYRPASTDPEGPAPEALSLEVRSQLRWTEELWKPTDPSLGGGDSDSKSRVGLGVVRRIEQGGAKIRGELRETTQGLRASRNLLVARRLEDRILVGCPDGPLTRPELDLLEIAADPLVFPDLVPDHDVEVGQSWELGRAIALSFSGYETLATHDLVGRLDSCDPESASITVAGRVRGALLGGVGVVEIQGRGRIDRRTDQLLELVLDCREEREAGPVQAGLVMTSQVRVEAGASDGSTSTSVWSSGRPERDVRVMPWSEDWERILYRSPDARFSMIHDRSWHTYWEDDRRSILVQLDLGRVVSQCNIQDGPTIEPGTHLDPGRFRQDIREALGPRFRQFESAQIFEPPVLPDNEFRYRVAVRGEAGQAEVVWFYYLLSHPDGRQLMATFTLSGPHRASFGDVDRRMMASLRWTPISGRPRRTRER